ncbi:oligopeptide transport system substrate-binding protein [Kushneria sinocarnis]|uniref:Oligopeptide transport system substrate-binding protein n=1 Tax=Kushneria sinocarnis TaxID=595502 RepID=A0A420WXU0_9GAMM|nr:peptide ABC transporter substrate-binding protein [Kushneria sinocarnis]RKR04492.1 oligopeptide transport system substrate-binding protein [Kushneria sinocarnis]
MTRLYPMMATAALLGALSLAPVAIEAAAAATLKVGISSDPASLDPGRITGGVWEEDVLRDIYEGLISIDAGGRIIPGVAESWQLADDGTTWTFELRDDAQWSDGEPVTAEDFVRALRYHANPQTASNYAHRLYPIVNAEAITRGDKPVDSLGVESRNDGHTLVIHLNEPTAYFLKTLVLPFGYPLPKHVMAQYGKAWSDIDHIVTNGPFKPVKWVSNTELETVKNPRFHAAEQVSLDGVDFYPLEDKSAAITRFRAGEVDVVRDFPAARYQWLKDNLPEAVHVAPSLGSYYYVFNTRKGTPTADRRVRRALSLAINREVIADKLLDGAVEPSRALVPGGVSHYTPQPQPGLDEPMPARMQKARQLLQQAGYGPEHPLELTLRYNAGTEHQRIAVAVAAMWKPLGVEITQRSSEANVHYADLMQGDFQVARAAWISSYDDAQNFLQLLSAETNNYGAWHSDEYSRLMARSDREQDREQRRALLEQAERVGLADYPLAPIYIYASRNLVNPAIEGWQDNALDMHPSRWLSLPQ